MAILSKLHRPGNFESHNSLKLSFTNIQALQLSFGRYESFLKANSPDILTYFMAPFYGWGSTASKLEPLRRGSLLFITKDAEIPGTHFISLRRLKS